MNKCNLACAGWMIASAATMVACATSAPPAAEPVAEQAVPAERLPDTRRERLQALPGVDRESSPENVESRFGFEEARRRREAGEGGPTRKRLGVESVQEPRQQQAPAQQASPQRSTTQQPSTQQAPPQPAQPQSP